MTNKNYCYFIISCKKNVKITCFCVEQLLRETRSGNIYISFDEKCDIGINDERVIVLDKYSEKNSCFGTRIQYSLKCVEEEYVIVMCDDFIVEAEVDESCLSQLKDYMVLNNKVSSIVLAKTSGKKTSERIMEHYCKYDKFAYFRATLQCSIWNKNAFFNLMNDVKSPWEFEIFSNYKTFSSCNLFYALDNDKYQPIKYNRGSFVIRGKIVEPERKRLEKVLRKEISIEGFETTDSYKQFSNLSFFDKINRRIRMNLCSLRYRFQAIFPKTNLNIRTED